MMKYNLINNLINLSTLILILRISVQNMVILVLLQVENLVIKENIMLQLEQVVKVKYGILQIKNHQILENNYHH
jgi:hypothetical protein